MKNQFLLNFYVRLPKCIAGVTNDKWHVLSAGVAPPSFVAIQAGQTLHTLTSTSDAWSWTSVTVLSIFALVSLVPVLLKSKLREKFE